MNGGSSEGSSSVAHRWTGLGIAVSLHRTGLTGRRRVRRGPETEGRSISSTLLGDCTAPAATSAGRRAALFAFPSSVTRGMMTPWGVTSRPAVAASAALKEPPLDSGTCVFAARLGERRCNHATSSPNKKMNCRRVLLWSQERDSERRRQTDGGWSKPILKEINPRNPSMERRRSFRSLTR